MISPWLCAILPCLCAIFPCYARFFPVMRDLSSLCAIFPRYARSSLGYARSPLIYVRFSLVMRDLPSLCAIFPRLCAIPPYLRAILPDNRTLGLKSKKHRKITSGARFNLLQSATNFEDLYESRILSVLPLLLFCLLLQSHCQSTV